MQLAISSLMAPKLQEAVTQSLNGLLPGAIFGCILSGGVYVVNNLLFEKQKPITFIVNHKTHDLYVPESLKGYKIDEELRSIQKSNLHPKLYNRSIVLIQKAVIIHEKFVASNDNKHKLHYIAKFQQQCMNIDLSLRLLTQAHNHPNALQSIQKASQAIHAMMENILSVIRDELAASDQMKSIPPIEPKN